MPTSRLRLRLRAVILLGGQGRVLKMDQELVTDGIGNRFAFILPFSE